MILFIKLAFSLEEGVFLMKSTDKLKVEKIDDNILKTL